VKYLKFPTREAAANYSFDAWRKVRPNPNPEDVTQFLYAIEEAEDGTTLICVPDDQIKHLDDGHAEMLLDKKPAAHTEKASYPFLRKEECFEADGQTRKAKVEPLGSPKGEQVARPLIIILR
jgi:hypothetical protein